MQDTGVIIGVTEAPQTVSFQGMAERQQALVAELLKDPAVESISSFIGVDGTNVTPNSGRVQINLKPLVQREPGVERIIRRLQRSVGDLTGIALYMQAVQDLSVEDRVSRTQYQYSLEHPDMAQLDLWGGEAPRSDAARAASCRTSRPTSRTAGCARISRSIATRRRGSASPRRWWTTRCTAPSASGRCRPSSRS